MKYGRKTDYKKKYNELAYKLCLLGCDDNRLAKFFNIQTSTLNNWKIKYPKFMESLKKGKEIADQNVAKSLYERAIGYKHKDLFITQFQGKIVKKEIIKHYPPDTAAAFIWLKNRQPGYWRDRKEIDFTDLRQVKKFEEKIKQIEEKQTINELISEINQSLQAAGINKIND